MQCLNCSPDVMIAYASCALNCSICGTAWILHTQLNMVTQWMSDAGLASWMCHSPWTAGHCTSPSPPDDRVPVQQSGLKSPHRSSRMLLILNHSVFFTAPKFEPCEYTFTVYHVLQRSTCKHVKIASRQWVPIGQLVLASCQQRCHGPAAQHSQGNSSGKVW